MEEERGIRGKRRDREGGKGRGETEREKRGEERGR